MQITVNRSDLEYPGSLTFFGMFFLQRVEGDLFVAMDICGKLVNELRL